MHPATDKMMNACEQPIEAAPQVQRPPENSSKKADLLAKIDSSIKDVQYDINRAIDRLSSDKAKIIALEKAKDEVINGRIGEGAAAILSETVWSF